MITILDGPLGTELISRGISLDSASWSAEAVGKASDLIGEIHRDYLQAGAQVHTTNTFRTTQEHCGSNWRSLTEKAIAITSQQIEASSERRSHHRIAGSLGPIADCYRPDQSPEDHAAEAHAEMANWLANCHCDLIFCETFANAVEAETAVREARKTTLETWIGLTAGPDGSLMKPGEMAEAAKRCVDVGAAAVIVQCTAAEASLAYVRQLESQRLDVAIGVAANAGASDQAIGWVPRHKTKQLEIAADRYVSLAESWVDSGATIIGACCGCSPVHIANLSARFQPN